MIQRMDSGAAPSRSRARSAPPTPWLLLFVVSLVLRLACTWWLGDRDAPAVPEAQAIDRIASSLARGAGFSDGAIAPLVPWLTSLVFRVRGHAPFEALALQCLLGSLVPLLLVALGSRLYGSATGWRAGWIAACDPLLVGASSALLIEAPLTSLLLLALLATLEWVRTPQRGRAFGAGLLWGLAVLTHPIAIASPLAIAAWAWVPLGLALTGRERLLQLAMLMLALALVVAPWSIRGSLRAGRPVVVTDTPAGPDISGNAGSRLSSMGLEGVSLERWQATHAARLRVPRVLDPFTIWAWLTLPLAAWGLALTARGARRWFQSIVPLLIATTLVAALVMPGVVRMRTPIEPLVVLLSAVGLDGVLRRVRTRGPRLTVIEGSTRA